MRKCLERIGSAHPRIRSFALAAVATALFAAGCTAMMEGAPDAKGKVKIQIDPSRPLYVEVEPIITDAFTWTEFINDRFYDQLERAFRQGGYKGLMAHTLVAGDPPEGAQALSIRIVRWRQQRNEAVEATITGSYDSGDGVKQQVSVATGLSTKAVAAVDGFSVEDAYFEAALIAARNMYRKIGPPKAPKVKTQ